MTQEEFEIIYTVQVSFYLLVALLAFIKYKVRDTYVKAIGLMFLASAFADVLSMAAYKYTINPNYVSAIYQIIAFPILSLIYYLITGKKNKFSFILLAALCSIFGIVNLLFIQKGTLNAYTLIVMSILVLTYCLYYFYWLLKELPTMHLQRLPMFWINSAFMIYYAGNLFLFVFTSYLITVLKVTQNLLTYWSFHNFLGIFEMSIIILALWLDLKNIRLKSL